MTKTSFAKTQALGNDFLIRRVEDVLSVPESAGLAKAMCDRKYGAGADGIVFFSTAGGERAPRFASRIFNADGSEAEISGNGTRCLAAYLHFAEMFTGSEVEIATAAGLKRGKLLSHVGRLYEFEFEMGEPRLSPSEIPIALDPHIERVVAYPLKAGGQELKVTCVSMGNPHCTLFLEKTQDLDLRETGSVLENHPLFPNRTNVEFARIRSEEEIEVAFWERGVGPTLSSGTGSSAAAVASALNGFTGRNVVVQTAGGKLRVHWRDDNTVTLTGGAEIIYEGQWLQ